MNFLLEFEEARLTTVRHLIICVVFVNRHLFQATCKLSF